MTLPPMNSVRSCVKCAYETRPTAWMMEYVIRNKQLMGNGEVAVLEDALRRTCPRCGYQWKEACADAG